MAGFFWICGPSGVGKSFLVHHIQQKLFENNGYFIFGGKYDQIQRNIPYAALIQGMNHLLQQILTEPPERLKYWQEHLKETIGQQWLQLVEILPSLRHLLGEQNSL